MNAGFVPALGTPLDENGYVVSSGYQAQIERLMEAGCCGVLAMGSMGQQAYLRTSETPKVARLTVEQVRGRVPVFVGAMDCSIHRAQERIASMEDLDIDGFVFTTPYYNPCSRDQVINFYKAVAASTSHQIFLYDLAVVTQTKITYDMVIQMKKEIPNLAGIKSADLQMLRKLKLLGEVPEDFIIMYSGLDTFDIAVKWGISNYLDGMIDCTPHNFEVMDKAMKAGDYVTAGQCLSNVVELRDFFVARDLWPSFTAAMNMLGFAGNFSPDYVSSISDAKVAEIRAELHKIGEL